ncbi:hypothetical protein [Yersinia phage vB_YenM_P744]
MFRWSNNTIPIINLNRSNRKKPEIFSLWLKVTALSGHQRQFPILHYLK